MTEEALVKTINAPEGTICLCNNAECSALTLAFRMMGDARKRFVVLPPYLEKGSSPHRNKQRESFLRYLLPKHDVRKETSSNYIALHHFHAGILWDSFQVSNSIPKTLSCGQAVELRMRLSEKDKVVDESGMPAFVFCPNYPLAQVKKDLEELSSETMIHEDPSVDHDSNAETKKQPTVFEELPKQVHVDTSDEDSDMSSIEIIVDQERDLITLTTLVDAAVKCQSFIRRCQTVPVVEQMKKERNAVVLLQSLVRMRMARSDFLHQQKAATLIQKTWRGYSGSNLLEQMATSAILIQRVVRGHQARQWLYYKIPNESAVMIQKHWRRCWVQGAYQLYLSDLVAVQKFVRQRAAVREVQDRRVAILMLQTNARRWNAQRIYHEQKRASVTIQAKWRQHVAYESFYKKPASAVVIQTAGRGLLARRHVQARTTSACAIQQAWRRNWHQIRENRMRKNAVTKIQTIARGYLCRKRTGWMVMFARLKAQEFRRRKVYEEMLDDAVMAWTCCLEMLDDGIQEIDRVERLIVGASLADQALAAALRSIAQDDFVHDVFGGSSPYTDVEQDKRLREQESDMPTDPVLKVLLNGDAKMADRYDDMSGSGLSEVGPALDSFRTELEQKVARVKGTCSAFVGSMPTSEMKATQKATQRAWEELHSVVVERWEGDDESFTTVKAGGAIRTTPPGLDTAQDKDTAVSKRTRALSDDGRRGSVTHEAISRARSEGEVKSSPKEAPPMQTPVRKTSRPVDMGFASATSPQSVITPVEDILSPPKSASKRNVMPSSPSSRRLLFGRQSSLDDFALARDLSADDCRLLVSEEGSQKRGIDFFDHLSDTLLTKSAPPSHPEWPSLSRTPSSSGSSSVKDRWLLEANYRAAAAHQALVWNAFMGLLAKMCDAAKEIELQRCVKLNSTILVAVPLERRILLEMREVQQEIVQELLAFRHDREYLSESVDTMIEHHAQLLRQRDSDHKSSVLDRFQNLGPNLSQSIESLEPESTYGVTHHAMVVERSSGLRSWKTTLVVATADRYMHLFDLSSISDIDVGSSPNEAFDLLLPDDDFTGDKRIFPRQEKLLEHLDPVSTVNLRKCRILTTDRETVEVTEKIPGVLRTSTRKFFLRGEADDLARWKHFLTRKTS